MERFFEMEGQLLLWIREVFASPVMDKIMIFISSLANKGMLWIGIGVVLLLLGVKGRKWSNRGYWCCFLWHSIWLSAIFC